MFKVSARTVLELGAELISSDAIAFYELIKNGIDAGTQTGIDVVFEVVLSRRGNDVVRELIDEQLESESDADGTHTLETLREELVDHLNVDSGDLYDEAIEIANAAKSLNALKSALGQIDALNSVTICDTGSGMSFEQLQSVFLVLGTKSRKVDVDSAFEDGAEDSPYLGEKGIGRLSAMRLGDKLTVSTSQQGDKTYSCLDIDWSEFDDPEKMIEDVEIEPYVGPQKEDPKESGTKIKISKLRADWNQKRVERLAVDDFSLLMNPLGEPSAHRIAIYWNGERINFERLDESFLSHAQARLSGKYRITNSAPELTLRMQISDLGFEHPVETHIETMSQVDLAAALVGLREKRSRENKRDTNMSALKSIGPFDFDLFWFNRRTLRKGRSTGEANALRNLVDQWMGVRLYRDGFRVYPYGTEDDDWLELDRTALRRQGYALNRIQFVGQVDIGRFSNPNLIDQTNREGLRHTPEEAILKDAIQLAVDRLRDEMKRVENEQKKAKAKIIVDEKESKNLEKRINRAIKSLAKSPDPEQQEVVSELEALHEEFSRQAAEARKRIAELEKDTGEMLAMAGIGLMVEVVAHELARSAEDALDTLHKLQRKNVPAEVRARLTSLRASMKSISKRLRVLDPLSVSGRQRKEQFELDELVRETLSAHEAQFERHNVSLATHYPDLPVPIKAVKGFVVQVLENLISNSVYWMDVEKDRSHSFKPKLTFVVESNPPRVRVTDNGPGISKEYRERVFDLFFSLKQKGKRRGLGLFIAKEAAEHNGGSLTIDTDIENAEGRYTTFDYQVTGDAE